MSTNKDESENKGEVVIKQEPDLTLLTLGSASQLIPFAESPAISDELRRRAKVQ